MNEQELEIVDTHCHLDFDWFDNDRDEVVERAKEAGVGRIIVPALDLEISRTILELTSRYQGIYTAVGVHPNSSSDWEAGWLESLGSLADHPTVVAIGEIGLDYYRDQSPKSTQQAALEAQLQLALDKSLPVILHNRNSDQDLISILQSSQLRGQNRAGVLHSFLTNWQIAREALDLGFYIGFTGPITYKKSGSLREIVKKVPLDRILVETDAPFLTPQEKRGGRNEPAYVYYVVEEIARIKQRPLEEIARITSSNAQALFGPKLYRQD